MIYDQQILTTPALLAENEPSIPFTSVRHRIGLQHLHRAFREPRPLAIITGRQTSEARQLVSSFLDCINCDVTVVRIDRTCSDALEGMREVISATGFNPQGMNLIELEIMFVKFLSLQRFHNNRTIFLIEESPDNDSWVSDKVRQLVELEAAGNFGLMVILSRQARLRKPTDDSNLNDMSPATIDLTKKARKLFPSASSMPPAAAETEVGLVELMLNTNTNETVPLKTILTHQGERLHELTLEQPRLMIGRAEDNDLCINNEKVSRHHALLVRHGAAAVIMDLNSTNGTYVNLSRIKDQVVVHNDIIVIGNHHIRFIAPSAPHSNGAD